MRRVGVEREIGLICLAGIAVTHLMDLKDKVDEAPYMAVLFCGLIVSSCVLGGMLLFNRRERLVWRVAGTLSLLTIVGYVLSRSVGLPQIEDHVGMWLQPAGVASLVFEGSLVVMALRLEVRLRRSVAPAYGRGTASPFAGGGA